jgi:hypothetical protein
MTEKGGCNIAFTSPQVCISSARLAQHILVALFVPNQNNLTGFGNMRPLLEKERFVATTDLFLENIGC